MTTQQKRMINLAEQAESYIKKKKRDEAKHQRPSSTKTNLENRDSHRKRVEEAKKKHVKGYD